jgi:Na+-driven multidrug efflux pump
MNKDFSSATAAILGALPGFTLPFVAAVSVSPRESDALLLAVSIAVTVSVIAGTPIELTTIAEYGRILGRDRNPAADALRSFRRRVLLFGGLLTAVVVPLMGLAYSIGTDRSNFLLLVCAVSVTPLLAAVSSLLSGECIARGCSVVPIAVQSMRSLFPALFLVAWPGTSLILIAAMLPAGEAARAVILSATLRRLRAQQAEAEATGDLAAHGLVALTLASGVGQLNAVVDRLFLASAGTGYISSYEISERLLFAAAQFITVAFVFRRSAAWARLPAMRLEEAKRLLRRDGRTLAVVTALLTVVGTTGCLAALVSGFVPSSWSLGVLWAAIVILSLPAYVFGVVGVRMLVMARKQRITLVINISGLALNAVLDAVFFVLTGPGGVIVVTVVLRWIKAGIYLAVLRRTLPRVIGEDLARNQTDSSHEGAVAGPEPYQGEIRVVDK